MSHLRCWIAALLSCCLSVPAFAAEALLPPDWKLTLEARRVLQDDRELAPLNVGVVVRNGVATLWGPIPSKHLAKRATECVKQGCAARAVRCELLVALTAEDSDPEAVASMANPMAGTKSAEVVAAKPMETLVAAPTIKPAPETPLVPTIQVTSRFEAAKAELDASNGLAASLDHLRTTEPRYRQLTLELKGNAVRLAGEARAWSDVWELAQVVARLPGVEAVRVGTIKVVRPE